MEALPAILSPIWLVFAKLEFQQTSSLKTSSGEKKSFFDKPLTEARPLRSLAAIWSPCGNGVELRVRVSRPVADTQRNCSLISWYSNRTVVGQACLGDSEEQEAPLHSRTSDSPKLVPDSPELKLPQPLICCTEGHGFGIEGVGWRGPGFTENPLFLCHTTLASRNLLWSSLSGQAYSCQRCIHLVQKELAHAFPLNRPQLYNMSAEKPSYHP